MDKQYCFAIVLKISGTNFDLFSNQIKCAVFMD